MPFLAFKLLLFEKIWNWPWRDMGTKSGLSCCQWAQASSGIGCQERDLEGKTVSALFCPNGILIAVAAQSVTMDSSLKLWPVGFRRLMSWITMTRKSGELLGGNSYKLRSWIMNSLWARECVGLLLLMGRAWGGTGYGLAGGESADLPTGRESSQLRGMERDMDLLIEIWGLLKFNNSVRANDGMEWLLNQRFEGRELAVLDLELVARLNFYPLL